MPIQIRKIYRMQGKKLKHLSVQKTHVPFVSTSMVKHQAGVERMARAIKQSVDGSGYPSSALFPIAGKREEEGRGPSGRRYLCDGRGYGRASERAERTIYIFGSVVASSLHECIAARKRKGGGGPARWNYNPHGSPLTRKTWTVNVVRINNL